MPPKRLLVLANKAAGLAPGQRYRFEQWAPRLRRDYAISLDLLPFESPQLTRILYESGHLVSKAAWISHDFWRRSRMLALAKDYDAILVFREAALIGPAIYERLLARSGKPIIYDFDDAIWSPAQAWKNGILSRLRFPSKTSTICKLATTVTVGNRFLADYALERNCSVHIIPSSIELDEYPLIPETASNEKFVVSWSGSTSTLVHFEHARPALERLAKQVRLAVTVICSEPPRSPIAGAETRFVAWSAEGEAEAIGNCHVGIMPLPDDEVSRGKCAMKALQYMATGRPVVVSPVGVNVEVVRNGKNGLLAGSEEEFVSSLLKLARSGELRRTMGRNARKTIEQRFSAEIAAEKFARIVRSILD